MRIPKTVVAVLGLLAALAGNASAQVAVEYYHLDAIGNVLVVTDNAGAVVEQHDYDAFGQEINAQPGIQPKRFTGKERDTETGWDYFGARYYGSRIGRFTTTDPLWTWEENLVDPQRWNRYAYVRNNPLRYVDPDGRGIVSKGAKLIIKGGDLAATFADVAADAAVFASPDPAIGPAARIGAVLSIVSEGLPVSVGDAKHGLQLLKKGGTYLLRKADDTRDVMRTGRTKDLARRRAEHARNPATEDLEFEVDRCTDCYAAQRGREQVIHDLHKPPLDRVNPISPKNPRREEYLQAAEKIKDQQ